jgi:hypothetical protein
MKRLIESYSKKYLRLKEDDNSGERDYAADTSGTDSNPSTIAMKTRSEHPVTMTGDEVDGDSSTQTQTVDVNGNDPKMNQNVKQMAQAFKQRNMPVNFRVDLNTESKIRSKKNLNEVRNNSISFTKREFNKFLTEV